MQWTRFLLEALRGGVSRSLVIRGEAGVGKTALGYLTERAADCLLISVTAVQSETELSPKGEDNGIGYH